MEPHVAEDEELQKFREWWKANGVSLLVGIGLGLAALGGFNGWKWYTEVQAESASTLFSNFQQAASADNLQLASDLLDELKDDYSGSPYTLSASVILASREFDATNTDQAKTHLQWVLDNSEEGAIRHTARLRMAYLELDAGNTDAAMSLLQVEEEGGFASQYAELKADAQVRAGNREEAAKLYAEAITALPRGSAYLEVLQAKQASSR